MLNIQYIKDKAISRDAAVTGNLTLQVSRHDNSDDSIVDVVMNGVIGYKKAYLFSLPNLSMDLELNVVSHGLTPSHDNLARRDSEDLGHVRARFIYSIGKLDLFLTSYVTYLDGDLEKTFQFQINRIVGS